MASERGFSRLVELLVAKRADLNSQDKVTLIFLKFTIYMYVDTYD